MELLAESLGSLAPRVVGNAPYALPRAAEALRYRLGKQASAAGDTALAAGWWEGVGATAAALGAACCGTAFGWAAGTGQPCPVAAAGSYENVRVAAGAGRLRCTW